MSTLRPEPTDVMFARAKKKKKNVKVTLARSWGDLQRIFPPSSSAGHPGVRT